MRISAHVIARDTPLLGQLREEVLKELGYTEAQIRALASEGAI